MKDYSFQLKVSDILLHSWSNDTVVFQHKFSTIISWLSEEWIQASIELEHLNNKEVLVTINHAACSVLRSCDRCGNNFLYRNTIQEKQCIATIWAKEGDDSIAIDERTEMIDLEQSLVDFFLLEEPLKCLCNDCVENTSTDIEENDDEQTLLQR